MLLPTEVTVLFQNPALINLMFCPQGRPPSIFSVVAVELFNTLLRVDQGVGLQVQDPCVWRPLLNTCRQLGHQLTDDLVI